MEVHTVTDTARQKIKGVLTCTFEPVLIVVCHQ